MRFYPAVATALFALVATQGLADDSAATVLPKLIYVIKIDPEAKEVEVTGTIEGHENAAVNRFNSLGIKKQVKINVGSSDGKAVFSYKVPIDQAKFKDTFKPVLNEKHCAIFLGSVLVAPNIKGIKFKEIKLQLQTPEGWKIATSRGLNDAAYTVSNFQDLAGTLVCAGDYSTFSFDLKHKSGGGAKTKFYVAIRGKRDWDDKEFVDEFKRLARGQMDYFGGSHPAPIQFLALHLLPRGLPPSIPGFNRRVPGHDTVLALHTPARPRKHFEFLGMLAHEHLHNWYPNAMKSDLGPWFMEGLNDYVAYRGLLANSLHTREQFTGMLSKWHREYRMCVRTKNQRVMPYRRGMIAGWVLDIEIRRSTGGKRGLTDVLLNLINEKPKGGNVQRTHFLAMLKKVSGDDMEPLYKHLVEDDGAIDLAKHLKGTGFGIASKNQAIEIKPETDEEKKLFDAILSE